MSSLQWTLLICANQWQPYSISETEMRAGCMINHRGVVLPSSVRNINTRWFEIWRQPSLVLTHSLTHHNKHFSKLGNSYVCYRLHELPLWTLCGAQCELVWTSSSWKSCKQQHKRTSNEPNTLITGTEEYIYKHGKKLFKVHFFFSLAGDLGISGINSFKMSIIKSWCAAQRPEPSNPQQRRLIRLYPVCRGNSKPE